jgi:hypothetical protein
MTEVRPRDVGETPTIEVRVYRSGELIHRELCESDEQATLAVEEWDDIGDVECEVNDLSPPHRGPEPVVREPAASPWEDYPRATESPTERPY